jgi:ribosomal protein L35AE/L33A
MFDLVSNDNPVRPAELYPKASPLLFAVLLILLSSLTSAFAASTVTVSLQSGVSGYNGARDTKLLSGMPTTNYGIADELELDGSPDASTLLYWDLASIPSGSIIQSVGITVEVTNSSSDSYELYELLRPWVEGEATWSQYASGQSWQVAGADGSGDRGSTVLGAMTAASTGLLTISLNGSGVAMVQWVNNPSSNHGVIILDYVNASNGLDFSSREAATIANRPKLTVTYVTDTNGQPVLAINDVTVTEGNTGTVQANFTVSLSPASTEAVTVNYATANGSATAGSDYVAVSAQVSFQPGQTSQPGTVVVKGDVIDEPNETFTVNLSNAVNATIVDNQGLGTISDDDGSSIPGERITFSVTGDYPYGRDELAILQRHVDEHNLYSPSDFFVHVGDIFSQSEGCQEQYYDDAANLLKQLEVPAFIVIGDNEWPDCTNPAQGFQWWFRRFAHFEDNFCRSPVVERQSVRLEIGPSS